MEKFLHNSLFALFLFISTAAITQAQNVVILPADKQEEVDRNLELSKRYKNEDNYQQAAFYMNKVALTYWEAGDAKKAIKFFLDIVPLDEKIKNYADIRAIYSNIALMYSDMNRLDRTLEYFEKSLEIRRKMNSKSEVSAGLIDVAYIQIALNQHDRAIKNLEEAYKLAQEINNPRLILNCLKLLSQCYEQKGNMAKNKEYQELFAQYEQQISNQQLKKRYDNIVTQTETKVEEERKQRTEQEAEMLLQQLKAKLAQDSLNYVVQTKEDSLQKATEYAHQRQIEIDNLNLQNKVKEEELLKQEAQQRQQQTLIYGAAIILFLTLVMATFIYRAYRNKKRINEQLNQQNVEIEKQRNHIQRQNENINKSINYAQGIQKAILPPQNDLLKYFPESFIFFHPRDIVSGDYYWFKETSGGYGSTEKTGKVVVTAVDCTGHGVPGAFLSMIGCNLLDEIIFSGVDNPGTILRRLNNEVVRTLRQEETENRDGMDMALCVVDQINKVVEFSGAKNTLVYVRNNEAFRIKADKLSIAGGTGHLKDDYKTVAIPVTEPTWFYLFSDGYIDQFGGKEGRKFMIKNFLDLLASIAILPAEQQRNMLKNNLRDWIGNQYQQVDDILVIGFLVEP